MNLQSNARLTKQQRVMSIIERKGLTLLHLRNGAVRIIGQGVDVMAISLAWIDPKDLKRGR